MSSRQPTLIASVASLRRLIAHVSELDRLGVDTEFHAERRYRPELMLVQLADDEGNAWIVDPRSVDIRPLAEAMSGRTWVVFAADTDLELLAALGGRPSTLHDPQRLAGLAGHAWPRSLADLCAAELGLEVDKAPALSDWSRRPLSESQRAYAADDALLALRLWDALAARVAPERVAWAVEDGDELIEAAGRPVDPDQRWLRMRIAPRLDRQARSALHRLAAWREAAAREAGQPPWSLLPDAHMLDLARRRPADLDAIRAHRRMHRGSIRKHGQTWLTLIHAAPDAETPPAPPTDREVRAALLTLAAHAIGRARQVSPHLLFTDRWTDRVLAEGPSALTGWRATVAREPLSALLSGSLAMTNTDWTPDFVTV